MSEYADDGQGAAYEAIRERYSSPEQIERSMAVSKRAVVECKEVPPEICNSAPSAAAMWVATRCLTIFDEGGPDAIEVACFTYAHLMRNLEATKAVRVSDLPTLREAAMTGGREALWRAMTNYQCPA